MSKFSDILKEYAEKSKGAYGVVLALDIRVLPKSAVVKSDKYVILEEAVSVKELKEKVKRNKQLWELIKRLKRPHALL